MAKENYADFLRSKIVVDRDVSFACLPEECNRLLKPHQAEIVAWAVRGGRRAIFSAFGLGKTVMQLEIVRLILAKLGRGRGLIVCPLGVRQEFKRDAAMLGLPIKFIRNTEFAEPTGLYLTNYESIREGKLDPRQFDVVSLDEAGILRGFGGTKTFREFMRYFEGSGKYRFVATATPSPNEFIELLAYAAFLDIMDVGQAKTRFFKRDSTKADALTIHPHKEQEFWLWVASWALFLQHPSDLGYADDGYTLPALEVCWHELPTDHARAGCDRNGQGRLLRDTSMGVQDAAREKRRSLAQRILKVQELRAAAPEEHRIIWHDLEDERLALEAAIPKLVSIYGRQDLDEREARIIDFSDGRIAELAGKPVMLGQGCNFQRHCARAIFMGIGFKFADFIQAVHRLQRFMQPRPVRIDLIYTEAEREVRAQLERKWRQHEEMVAAMTAIIKEHGLAHESLRAKLARSLGCERAEETGAQWRLVNNDAIDELPRLAGDTVGLVLTSIPFSTQYEYSPSYHDFGHNSDAAAFWRQMDYLTPELVRVLMPGRLCAIHVKDRIAPGGFTGLGFQTVQPFHADAIAHYMRHGLAYLGMKTIVTDVVRENNQTYRLGWTEQCKDGSRMGCGMPEYLLIFRKSPTDRSNGYADMPVVKRKDSYSRGRWQLDAHGFMRSSGDRLLQAADLRGLAHGKIYKLFRQDSLSCIYDFKRHLNIAEMLDAWKMLPVTFMLLPPQSWHPDVWTDITRMRTLNGAQSAAGREMHLCPMQFDLADRAITQYTQPGEIVLDPFSGLGTVPLRALMLNRKGLGIELNPAYHADAVYYLRAQEADLKTPTLFEMVEDNVPIEAGNLLQPTAEKDS